MSSLPPKRGPRTQSHHFSHYVIKKLTRASQFAIYLPVYIGLCLLANSVLSDGQKHEAFVHYVYLIPVCFILSCFTVQDEKMTE